MKDKEYYIEVFNKRWDKCLQEAEEEIKEYGYSTGIVDLAMEIFNEISIAEEVVGYYIVYHGNDALRDWLDNTIGKTLTTSQIGVDKILKDLYQNGQARMKQCGFNR